MKKILVLLFCCSVFLNGCTCKYEFCVGDSIKEINDGYERCADFGPIRVYKTAESYLLIVTKDGITVEKIAEFSSDRKFTRVKGIRFMKKCDVYQFLNKSFSEVKKTLGNDYYEVGSGFFIPSYITDDAYLIEFCVDINTITEIRKTDLMNGNVIEYKSTFR